MFNNLSLSIYILYKIVYTLTKKSLDLCLSVNLYQVSEEAIVKRYNQGWLEEYTNDLDELMAKLRQYRRQNKVTSLGYHGNIVDLWYEISLEMY